MTSERLLTFLENPAEMASVTYQEMKTLAIAYPYAANLRVLLLLKSEQEKHWERDQNLSMAALYSPDRKRLHRLLAPKLGVVKVSETISAPAELVLELMPLAAAEQEIAARKAAELEAGQKVAAAPAPAARTAEVSPDFEKRQAGFEEKAAPPRPEFARPAVAKTFEELVVKPVPMRSTATGPKPFDFGAWYGQFVLPTLPERKPRPAAKVADNQSVGRPTVAAKVVERKVEAVPPEPAADPEKEREAAVKKLVKRSVKEKEDIASETLAKLYARQGYKDKAAAMYHRLMVAFPEKSATFAAEIEKLGR